MQLQPAEPRFPEPRFTVTTGHGRTVIAVTGDFDISTAATLCTRLSDAIDDNAATANTSKVVFADLSAVTFMDASGLTALLRADRYARGSGSRLRLIELPERITLLLRITRLDHYFNPCPPTGTARRDAPDGSTGADSGQREFELSAGELS